MTAKEFDPWEIAPTKEVAHMKIANRLHLMKELHMECILIAQAHGIVVTFDLEVPEEAAGGHNGNIYTSWNPSSKHC